MAVEITNQVAIITGASRGIGANCALALAREGCRLVLTASREDGLKDIAGRCASLGAEVAVRAVDLRRPGAAGQLVAQAVETFGALNILVNNAGVWQPGDADDADPEGLDEMLDVNLRGAVQLTRQALPPIIDGASSSPGRGAVIFIASMSGIRTYPGGSGYCATKFGVVGYARGLWDDVAHRGVKVSAICPGWVNTDMAADSGLDVTQMIQPEDVAELVRMVATWPATSCPKEIHVMPQATLPGRGVD